MVNITTEQIKELRDESNVSIMQCKKALEEAGGDKDKALVILRKKSGALAAKKSDRNLKSGVIGAYVHSNGAIAAMVTLSCETDFVARNEDFKKLAYNIAMHVAATNPEYLRMEEVDTADRKKASEVFLPGVLKKPKEMQDKILQAKLDSYFGERVLLEQPFVKNQEVTIKSEIDSAIQKFGEKIEISKFVRFNIVDK